jgi:hypothetical protein
MCVKVHDAGMEDNAETWERKERFLTGAFPMGY